MTAKAGTAAVAGARDLQTSRRLATLHLRTGSWMLARAELEMLHSRGALDTSGLADLAEARWRAGDLDGAAVVARAHLGFGGTSPIALVIAAEEAAATGDREAAHLHIAALGELGPSDIEELYAGMPQRVSWSAGPEEGPEAGAPVAPIQVRDAAHDAAPPIDGAALVVQARLDLRGADAAAAAVALTRLALALRLDPLLAAEVLAALDRRGEPAAFLIRGDALRILGRRLEAEAAYGAAATALDRPSRRLRNRAPGPSSPEA